MRGAERQLTHRERTLEQLERLAELSASRTGLGQMLDRRGGREVVRGERALPNVEHASPELLGCIVTSERLSDAGERREHRGHFGVIFALRPLDGVQLEQQWLREPVRRLLQV